MIKKERRVGINANENNIRKKNLVNITLCQRYQFRNGRLKCNRWSLSATLHLYPDFVQSQGKPDIYIKKKYFLVCCVRTWNFFIYQIISLYI